MLAAANALPRVAGVGKELGRGVLLPAAVEPSPHCAALARSLLERRVATAAPRGEHGRRQGRRRGLRLQQTLGQLGEGAERPPRAQSEGAQLLGEGEFLLRVKTYHNRWAGIQRETRAKMLQKKDTLLNSF